MTVDKHSWGFRRNAKIEDFYSINDLIRILTETVSCGGEFVNNLRRVAIKGF